MKKILLLIPFIATFLFLSGCGPSEVIVRERPPEPHYIQPLAPGPGYVWHSGEWIRHGHSYVYRRGFWMRAPRSGREYAAGHWERRRSGWIWISGHWL